MEITLTTPSLLFPAITLLLLAYANRFFNLSKLIRELHAHRTPENAEHTRAQIGSLRKRLAYIKWMQVFGVLGILASLITMFAVFTGIQVFAGILLGSAILLLIASLYCALREVLISDRALSIALTDMERQDLQ